MPTRADFESAAETFLAASRQLHGLTAAVEQAGVEDILHGGSLGRSVPAQIAASTATVRTCQTLIDDAAATCSRRAAVIAEYELRLEAYDHAYRAYDQRSFHWQVRYNHWWSTPDEVAHPGGRPVPPVKPAAPPIWAEVRRV